MQWNIWSVFGSTDGWLPFSSKEESPCLCLQNYTWGIANRQKGPEAKKQKPTNTSTGASRDTQVFPASS